MRKIVHLNGDGTFELNLDYFRHHIEKTTYTWDSGAPAVQSLFTAALEAELGPPRGGDEPLSDRHKDIARSVQAMYEDAFFHLLNALHARYGNDSLALAGGCAMNSVANGKITKATPFRHVYVQAAAGDAGGAIGAAMTVWHRLNGGARSSAMDHAYWGPAFDDNEVDELLRSRDDVLSQAGCTVSRVAGEGELCVKAAEAIAAGKVVGWFQGRMEWGPRALGNRSILADPRRRDMKDILNQKIKRRESFRPFAPSILREAVTAWFETDDDVPFMEKVFVIREEKREQIPAVVHVDGTGRLQTVTRQSNSRYYRLIETFWRLTGVPMLLNTSFNENEPIVCRPEEALDCFLRTRMDVLVLGNWYLARTGSHD
jgi:carbamoyltransferase